MARKELDIAISDDGRDNGKVFHLKEMPARQAEKWAYKAVMAIARSGVDIGDAVGGSMQHLFILGISAALKMNFDDAEPLLDEMLGCITHVPNPEHPNITRPLWEDDIEEVKTLFKLRQEVLDLHMGFSAAGALSKQTSEPSASSSSNTQTSVDPSVRFSRSAKTKPAR